MKTITSFLGMFHLVMCLAQEVSIPVGSLEIKGSLLQANPSKEFVALIIAGSGPTDRNGNSPAGIQTNAYKMLAEELAEQGISSLRYDKRWIGESIPQGLDYNRVILEDYILDARALVDYLAGEGYKRIVLVGHSEGSLIAMVAAKNNPKVSGVISISGAGKLITDIIVDQVSAQSAELGQQTRVLMDSVLEGYSPKKINPFLLSIFNPSVYKFFQSYARNHPAQLAAEMTQPFMIVNGTTDIQVGVEQAEMLREANPNATYKIYEGMNHVLKSAPADRMQNIATYSNPSLPLFDGLSNDITLFIKSL